jgi:Na+/H+ antiporter NhaD/arsenite permease-like protein
VPSDRRLLPTNVIAAILVVTVFGAVIVRQVTSRGAPIWTLFVAGAFATIAVGVLTVSEAETSIAASAPTLIFLFSLFLFAGALDGAGVLDHLARWILSRPRKPADLPFDLFVGIGIVSAIMVNDALVVIGVPLLIGVASRLKSDPKPLLLILAFSVTVGSTLTPFGNPQNLLVALASGVSSPVTTFLRYLALPAAINLLLGGWYVRWVYRSKLASTASQIPPVRERVRLFPESGWTQRLVAYPVLLIFPATMVVLATLDVTAAVTGGPEVPVWEVALGGAVLLLLVSPGRSQTIQRVNWSILLLFAGLFVVVAGAVEGGVIASLDGVFPVPGAGHPTGALLAVVGTSIAGSQFVSNVPWVALQIPVLSGLGYGAGTPIIWVALAASSTLAGNVTLLGAVSNLIVVDSAEKLGVRIRLSEFVRHGVPLAGLTIAVLVLCLAVGLWCSLTGHLTG